ncbi:FmdB family zinc ribbon protein [Gulosibacter sp. GYB002]|uniref:FmdB family zinc ribbon protein n=1 Tax=Gulosibacter sp. GYB002 TaxID=2994391 RepID=UPI003FA5376E
MVTATSTTLSPVTADEGVRMPLYEFKCPERHVSVALMPISTATRERECPDCGATAHRRISAPTVFTANRAAVAAIDATERSAHEPQLVSGLPTSGAKSPTRVTHDPAHRGLPRP